MTEPWNEGRPALLGKGRAGPVTIEIPDWHPALLNALLGLHWAKAHRLKKMDQAVVAAASAGLPKAKGKRQVKTTVVFPRGRPGRKPDPDGYLKSLLDALVAAGMLVDDSDKWAAWERPVFEVGDRKLTRIELTDIAEPEGE